MTKEVFNQLSFKERALQVKFAGDFVTSIRYYAYKINLYLIDSLYVEVFFHHINDRIEKIEILDQKSTRLKFYTDQIRIPRHL